MSKLSLREIAQSQLDSTPVIDGQLIVCLDTGNAYRDTATAHVKIGSDLEVVSDLPLAPLAEKLYYLKPDKLYVFLGGNWTLLNDKTIDLDEVIAKLPAGSSTSLNDDVEIITQDTDITQSHYYRRKLVVLWEYIKTKAQDFFAAKNHKHGKADITDFPTSMPASDVYPWAKAATKPSYTKAEVGLGKVDNTADADKTVKRATTAGTADSANSVAWENVKDKPTAFPVEAHTHDDRYYTEAEVDGKLNEKLHEASYQGDLNDLTTTGLYHLYGTNTNVPANGNATVYVDFNVGTPYQVWTYDMDGTTYRRTRSSGSWTGWTQLSFTDTKDWTSITGKPSTFPPEAHNHDDRYYTEAEMDGKLGSKVDNTEAGANGLINKLESGTAVPVDNDLIVTQWANHTTATAADQNRYVRRPMSSIWSYIKSKADSVYQPKGSYAASGHTHTKDQVGLGNVDNTADKDKNVSTARGISVCDPVLATGAECSEITGKINDNKSLGTTAANAGVWGLRNALDFRWYDTHWQIGNLRSGSTPSAGFGFAFKDEGENSFSLKARILTDGTYEGNISGNAATAGSANSLSGLSSRSSQGWGVQTGTFIHGEGDSTGGDFAFRRDCPNAGQLSMVIDGRFYQNEGQYRVLDESDKSQFATAGHTHNSVNDIGSGKPTTFAYSKDGMNYGDYTWLAGWNGYEMRAVNKNQFATAGHTHNYAGSGSAGGSANSAVKLDSSAGSNTQPVYFSGGKPVVIGYTIAKSVPADAKFTDTTYGVASSTTNGLMSSTDKIKLDDFSRVISIQKQIKLTTDWQDTGIAGTSLDTGTYVVQVSGFNSSYTSLYGEIYSGIMTWYANETNSDNSSEIFLHNAGHADNSNAIYLRTSRRWYSNGGLHLQIACKVAASGTDTLTFKLRRLI